MDEAVLDKKVKDFRPDVFLVSSWHVPVYRRLLRRYPKIPKVVRFDNQWFGTWRQKLGALVAPLYIHKTFEAAFVGGERQAEFARHIGFKEQQIWHSAFSCDTDRFNRIYRQRKGQAGGNPRSFLFVGLLLPKKGVGPLAEAYRSYRARTQDPWPLTVCGLGPLAEVLEGQAGVDMRGFVQPPDMAEIYAQSSCLLAPSTFEPWGYVPHEAAAAGLAVITTTVVGSSVHLVRDCFNGFLIPPEDAESLANAMLRYTSLSDERRRTMADNSYSLSLQFTPQLWAENFHSRASDLIARKGRS
jgi:glycosyltransferase involved in cell wall biosynthesis